jgi:hypothetical protein
VLLPGVGKGLFVLPGAEGKATVFKEVAGGLSSNPAVKGRARKLFREPPGAKANACDETA